jgi:hypothetical protein
MEGVYPNTQPIGRGVWVRPKAGTTPGTIRPSTRYRWSLEDAMRTFFGMILGALLLTAGVYVYDSMNTSSVANGQVAQANRTIVNWDVAATDWQALKVRAQNDWVKISSK